MSCRSLAWLLLAAFAGCSTPRSAPSDTGAPGDDASMPGLDAASPDDAAVSTETRLATSATLDGLALFQGTRVALFEGGAPAARNAPVVAERRAVVRAYLGAGASGSVTGELEIRDGGRVVSVVRDTIVASGASSDERPGSVLAFDVPAEAVTPTASFTVRLIDAAGTVPVDGTPHPARLPRDGSLASLDARSDAGGLHLVLVPLAWDGDGSGRLPDTSPAQLAIFRDLLLSVYPLSHVTIDVHDPIAWNDSLTFTGNVDFGAVNSMLMTLRSTDGAPPGAYYYALVNAADTYDAYCGGSCVTGQSYVTDAPEDADFRVGSGVGFSGENTAWTLVHEIGHEHGRYHAPCDAGGADVDFPYTDGVIGVWGLDQRTGTFQDPAVQSDFMGYCDPTWTSDYTWSAIFERTVAVAALARHARAPSLLVRIGGEVGARLAGTVQVRTPHTTQTTAGTWLDAGGHALGVVLAPTLVQSHTDERLAVFPEPPPSAVALSVAGRVLPL